VAWGMNPYSKYKEVKCICDATPVLSDAEMENAVAAFKNGKTYKALLDSNCHLLLNSIDKEKMAGLMHILERDIVRGINGDELRDFLDLAMNCGKSMDAPGVLFEYSVLIYALRESLALACQMLFRAMDAKNIKKELTVLNNDNIINIEDIESNIFSKVYKVLTLEMTFDECGDILLIDCDDRFDHHTHEFGWILTISMNFASESGETTKYTFAVVNEELIYIPNLTGLIVRNGLPQVKMEH
jgi:hypothetical protein